MSKHFQSNMVHSQITEAVEVRVSLLGRKSKFNKARSRSRYTYNAKGQKKCNKRVHIICK